VSQQELLNRVVKALDAAGIQYMLTGSIASSFYGEPRATHDIDLVVNIRKEKVEQILQAFQPPNFYLDKDSILSAISNKSMFNLIDVNSGYKVDFWTLTDQPFDESRFSRKRIERFSGLELAVSSPEDTILMKLRWSRLSGGSEKQFIDAMRVFEIKYHELDFGYLEHWVQELEVISLWERLRKEAQIV
jgi:hypothetical protein